MIYDPDWYRILSHEVDYGAPFRINGEDKVGLYQQDIIQPDSIRRNLSSGMIEIVEVGGIVDIVDDSEIISIEHVGMDADDLRQQKLKHGNGGII